ncbi:hypothetical protein PR048_030531 [Dryococelus australis]|uniref:Uncharacterized protein n=1 Tax=Dryococelus australis TaxID=614101 RepID=A0ABQ9G986_9NEOP|nr:hypothetical protein PR048_030531 [Dryococelus australis]
MTGACIELSYRRFINKMIGSQMKNPISTRSTTRTLHASSEPRACYTYLIDVSPLREINVADGRFAAANAGPRMITTCSMGRFNAEARAYTCGPQPGDLIQLATVSACWNGRDEHAPCMASCLRPRPYRLAFITTVVGLALSVEPGGSPGPEMIQGPFTRSNFPFELPTVFTEFNSLDAYTTSGRGDRAVRLLASRQGESGSTVGTGSLPDFHMWESCQTMPLVGGFSRGYPCNARPCVPALFHFHLVSPSSALKSSLLRNVQISQLNSY